jgi:LL-diaminopimelate aminotransferase
MMKTSSERMKTFPDHFFAGLDGKIKEMQARGEEVLRLDVGSPDLPPATHIIETLNRSAAQADHHGYQSYLGPQALREAWAATYQRLYQVKFDPDSEIIPLMGSKEGIFNLVMATIDPGDVVLIPDPAYLTYDRATNFAGGEPVYLPLVAENDYLPDLGVIPDQLLKRAKLLWLNYPNNPTGGVANLEFFTRAVAFARQHNLLLCHDAAYTQVTFDGYQAPSLLQVPGAKDVAVEFNTLSKSHNMAGWREGVAVGNRRALESLYALKSNIDSGQFLPIMDAATAALTGDQGWLFQRNEIYRQRRDLIISALHSSGLNPLVPLGSLYIWCPVPAGFTSESFVSTLLDQAAVSLTPGTVFGMNGEGYVRIALSAPTEKIEEAMRRMTHVMQITGGTIR